MENRKQTDNVVYDDIIEDSESDGEVFEGPGMNMKDQWIPKQGYFLKYF